jgi:tetratricopeptide (TPR) repeat protein
VPRNRSLFFAGGVIALAALAAYHNSFSAPFVFDAAPIVTRYPTIRHLWPLWDALRPPHDGSTVDGRPMVNLVLAISYALSGTRVWAYHAVDLAIHILAALTLFGIIRRTLDGIIRRTLEKVGTGGPPVRAQPETRTERPDGRAARPYLMAFAAALLWTVHPLQTESITYVIQCAESLMGLFYLLTLYCFIRGTEEAAAARSWLPLSILCCLLGMATKEVMVTAPLMVFLYDRTFVAGGFREAWRRRWKFYLPLAGTWILLAWLVAGSGSRSGSAGFGVNISWPDYALSQIYAVVHYVRLALWPRPLVFDYGTALVTQAGPIIPSALGLLVLLVGTLWALKRRPALGFLGAWFFAILAPTSLVPVVTQPIAEHRMYLPLAAVMVLAALGLFTLAAAAARTSAGRIGLAASLVLAGVYGVMTFHRNALYASEITLWADTAAKAPENPRARLHLGRALYDSNRIAEADEQFRRALQLQPSGNFDAQFDLGDAILREGRPAEAIGHLAEAVRLKPDSFAAQSSWGDALFAAGQVGPAMEHYEQALRLNPGYALAHYNLGNAEAQLGRMPEAIGQYEAALRLNPGYAEAEDNLGNALSEEQRFAAALAHYEAAARLAPENPRVQDNLGNALLRAGRIAEAKEHYEAALRLKPDFAEVRDMLSRLSSANRQ